MNYLPLKLEKLRKHYNYSQSYLADFLGIEVVDYMGYENGRNMLNYAQIKRLASLYHIEVIELFRNDLDVTLYDIANADTDKVNIEYFIPKKTLLTRAKEKPILSGMIAALIVVLIGATVLTIKNKNRPYVSYADDTDRLAVSQISTIYIDNLGAVKGTGDNSNGQISNLPSEHAIKVTEGSNFSIILLEDGTLTSSGLIENYQKEISKWKNIVDIGAGDNHIVGVDNNGEVYCVGDNSKGQCNLDDFQDIKKVFCLANSTIGIDDKGNIIIAGEFVGTSTLRKYNNVLDVDGSEDNLIVLKEDGTCDYIASFDNSVYSRILGWKNIVDVACGKDFFAGLKNDGTVEIASLSINEDMVISWNNIIAIDSGEDYLIGFNGQTIEGVGKNYYHQFESNETSLQTLPKVKNINIDYDEKEVNVSFESVNNANEFEVTLIIDGQTKIEKTVKANEQAKFDASALTDSTLYTVTVVAKGDEQVYGDSMVAREEFLFIKDKQEVSEEKIKVNAKLSGAYKEDFENYLINTLGIEDIEGIVDENNICENGIETVLEINGITPGNTYSKSELNTKKVQYTYCKLVLDIPTELLNEESNLED